MGIGDHSHALATANRFHILSLLLEHAQRRRASEHPNLATTHSHTHPIPMGMPDGNPLRCRPSPGVRRRPCARGVAGRWLRPHKMITQNSA
jgi:hypothetical protein